MKFLSYFKKLIQDKRATKKLRNKYKGSRIIMYKNGFPPMETDDIRHPYSALYATGWRTRKQLEDKNVILQFLDSTRRQGGQIINISLCWFGSLEKSLT